MNRAPATHDLEITDAILSEVTEEPEYPDSANRIEIAPGPSFTTWNIDILTDRECIGARVAQRMSVMARVTDQNGNGLTDASAVIAGLGKDTVALLPLGGAGEDLGGHKGYGLAVMVEILSSSMQMGAFMHGLLGHDKDHKPIPFMVGHFFMAIDIEHFLTLEESKRITGAIMRGLQEANRAPGEDRIYVAGEKEFESEARVRALGVPVNSNLRQQMCAVRDALHLEAYRTYF